jgi:hypothetical protein
MDKKRKWWFLAKVEGEDNLMPQPRYIDAIYALRLVVFFTMLAVLLSLGLLPYFLEKSVSLLLEKETEVPPVLGEVLRPVVIILWVQIFALLTVSYFSYFCAIFFSNINQHLTAIRQENIFKYIFRTAVDPSLLALLIVFFWNMADTSNSSVRFALLLTCVANIAFNTHAFFMFRNFSKMRLVGANNSTDENKPNIFGES